MNYNEALEYIHETNKFGSVLGLENIKELLELMGNPQKDLKFIHVAGTNGKGSTCSYITSILSKAGYNVGLFTSPYLETFNERIRIGSENIPNDDLAEVTTFAKESVEKMLEKGFNHPTEFELVTAIAFEYYKRKKVDYVVLEVGLGGRYDSTNIIDKSIASVIVPIAMDHIDVLGDTLGKIAYEKAGIIKENGFVITYPQEPEAKEVVETVAKEQNAELITVPTENVSIKEVSEMGTKFNFKYGNYELEDLQISLIGKHQAYNASTALTTLFALRDKGEINITEEHVRKGLEETKWIGRLELLKKSPRFIIDGAHNMQGIEALKKTLQEIFNYDKLILGLGILADKDVDHMIAEMAPLGDQIIVTEANIFRAMKAEELAERISKYNKNYIVEKDIEKAIDKAIEMAGENDLILFSGSLYLIGDVRKYAKNK
ncbi:folylpolyglutamate synthetase FolC [Gottschalkia acidurici 9a]|uniref:Dihydrofolate synthase/folylpolyglutamate synthase n=1 Tax=Gottschalkia acidurici (strain ATCC 7906 / DSM 604 / BCRC 14475 / CIP 104303 / KCTC 5404 / NCIMB 10678 / 9a) TaxID=1128398 RepID=K0AZX7_GOTA9|nr:folylpolyglutamate synthase/dihydrofolate synthase family protein [Gottschalkia acidurici]AFS77896.1 folylpolyglutamate synthetase FolC [Gottschalkia acidurici 9a]